MPVGTFSATTASFDKPSRCLIRARSELPCAARYRFEQVRVPRVADLAVLVVVGQRRWRHIVGATPQHELVVAELGPHGGFVLALQRAVVPLVQPPRTAHGDPLPIGDVEADLCRVDRPAQQRRVHHVGQQAVLDEQLAAATRLVLTGGAGVDVDRSGEQVLLVPVALTVAEQHERGHAAILPDQAATPRSTVSTMKSTCRLVTGSWCVITELMIGETSMAIIHSTSTSWRMLPSSLPRSMIAGIMARRGATKRARNSRYRSGRSMPSAASRRISPPNRPTTHTERI